MAAIYNFPASSSRPAPACSIAKTNLEKIASEFLDRVQQGNVRSVVIVERNHNSDTIVSAEVAPQDEEMLCHEMLQAVLQIYS